MSPFLENPIKTSLSRHEIGEVIGALTNAVERMNLEMDLYKNNTTNRFDAIEYHLLKLTSGY